MEAVKRNETKRPISVEKEWDFVSQQVSENNVRIMDSFKLYVQVTTAIVGGSIYLSTATRDTSKNAVYALLSTALVALVSGVAGVMIYENLRSWRGYRSAQSRLGGLDEQGKPYIEGPRALYGARVETALMIAMALFAIGFWCFNPFRL